MTEPAFPTRVIKLGGSRLSTGNLKAQLGHWLSRQSRARNIWIVGGGPAVEQLRRTDQRMDLNATDVHWKAIRLMDENANHLKSLFPDWPIANSVAAASILDSEFANQILHVSAWLLKCEQQLPMTWEVTSDSIAAVVARRTGADELVLLKSTDPPLDGVIDSAIQASFVDAYFKSAVAQWSSETNGARVRVVNMETSDYRQSELRVR